MSNRCPVPFSSGMRDPSRITGPDNIVFSDQMRKDQSGQDLIALAISGATDTVLTPLSNVSVARTASTPER